MLKFNVIFAFALINSVYAQDVEIEPASRVLFVVEGSRLTVVCSNKLFTEQRPIWFKVSSSPATVTLITDHLNGKTVERAQMEFQSFSQDDVGIYNCSLSPTSQKISINLKMIKEYKVGDHFYYGNKTTTLSCHIEIQDTTVTFLEWQYQHAPGDSHFKLQEGNSSITIDRPTREDAGVYNAIFKINQPGFEAINHTCSVEYTAGPLVLNMKRSKNLDLNEDLHLICEILGYPPAVAKWVRNSVVNITQDERTEIKEYNGYKGAELVIKSIKYEEAGNYTCIAYSAEFMNSSSKSITVRVKDPLAWVWPLAGIAAEIVLLALIILICSKIQNRRMKINENEPFKRGGSRKQGEKYE
ncbi:unnamed protein product [Lymnaea stagnalis]|uniref:Ig-like domain-containing protein n=1 Tax=Lymnaea stagnalis TaxID=6523 RepID=A0AAV2HZW5_LYMST